METQDLRIRGLFCDEFDQELAKIVNVLYENVFYDRIKEQGEAYMKHYLTVDVGGTMIKYALMDEKTVIHEKGEVPVPRDTLENFIETIGRLYDKYAKRISGIAFSVPGVIDVERGHMYSGGALKYIVDCPMRDLLSKRVPIPMSFENDGKCATLAELWMGSMKNVKNGVIILLGTGIGGGVIIDHKLHRGLNYAAGEFSSLLNNLYTFDEKPHSWWELNGNTGLLQPFAEKKHLDIHDVNGRMLFEAYHAHDEDAIKTVERFCETLANGIFSIQCILDVEKFSIGGGISAQDVLIETIRRKVNRLFDITAFEQMPIIRPQIERCAFANDSNLIGALYNHLELNKGIKEFF
jgi:predicted NBD/HSP70 family sugar kinase